MRLAIVVLSTTGLRRGELTRLAVGESHGLYTKTLKRGVPANGPGPHPTSESALYATLPALCEPFEEGGVRQPVCQLPAARRGLHRAFPLSPDADERVAAQRRRDVVRQLERRMLRRGVFTSVTDLRETIRAFIDSHNTHAAKPFRWIKSAQTMLGAVIPAHETLRKEISRTGHGAGVPEARTGLLRSRCRRRCSLDQR